MDVGHLVTLVLAAGGALTAAIGIMYRTIIDQGKEQANIREEIGTLKGERDGLERLSASVLETVHELHTQSIQRQQANQQPYEDCHHHNNSHPAANGVRNGND